MSAYSPAWPHGELTPVLDELWYVMGTNRVHHAGVDLQTSRTMLVVREGDALTLVNTVRLDDDGLRALDALGSIRDVVRLGAFHGRDDPFYRDRYGARLWAVPGSAHADQRPEDRPIAENGELPIAGATAHVFATARQPEAALRLERSGGVLVTCDAVQSWAYVDRFFSPETGAAFEAAGLIGAARVPSTWLEACAPDASDFERLLALPFRHLVSAHGEPLLEDAHERLAVNVRRVFIERGRRRSAPLAASHAARSARLTRQRAVRADRRSRRRRARTRGRGRCRCPTPSRASAALRAPPRPRRTRGCAGGSAA